MILKKCFVLIVLCLLCPAVFSQTDFLSNDLPIGKENELAPSATFTVTKTADTNDGVCNADCSLREAIAAANAAATDDIINFDATVFATAQTITLSLGQLSISSNGALTISGTGANLLTISGNNASRVFNIVSGGNASISGVRITGGNGNGGNGGGILNAGTLNLTNSTVSGNASATNNGGGINNFGTLSLTNSTVSGNSASSGGGVSLNGPMNLTNSTVSNNSASFSGGGISINSGTITVNLANSVISGNSAEVSGGGLHNGGGGTTNITNCTVTGNSAFNGGGISFAGGTPRLRNTISSGNTANNDPDVRGSLSFNENNLIGGNPLFAPIGIYGGTTQSIALLSSSPAINAGNNCVLTMSCTTFNAPTPLTTDQRGAARVGNVDIGAFEANSSANGGTFRATLPRGSVNSPYNFTLVPNNGTTTYAVTGGTLPPGMNLTTTLAPSAVVALGGTPTIGGIYNFSVTATNGANTNVTDYSIEVLTPTSAGVSVSGRVLTADGRGVTNAVVVITDSSGNVRSVRTGTFGYFRFDSVSAGQTYIVTVNSKRFIFPPRVVEISDELTNLNFIADGRD